MKPTSPQPPGLTDADYERLMDIACGEEGRFLARRLADAAFAAGCAAQRKADAAELRRLAAVERTVPNGPVSIALLDAAAAIERTPEQPTTERCGTCGSDDPATKIPLSLMGGEMWCEDAFHSQPTTGEAGK